MTQFLMDLNEAVDLVLFAFSHGHTGDLFIQKSPASTIGTLAEVVKQLFNPDAEVHEIGIRHGEKMFETLMTSEERIKSEDMGDYFRVPIDSRNFEKNLVATLKVGGHEVLEYHQLRKEELGMRNILVVALSLICLTCAGCFQANFDLIITSDGAVVRNWKLLGTVPFLQQIEDWKATNEKVFPNIRVTPISEGDMLGYEFKLDYPDIESFAKSWGEIYSAHAGENKGVSRQNGWFFDAYEFDFYFMSPPVKIPPEAEYFTQAAFDSVIYDATIQLPYSADSHDADEISADGKLLKWNLAPVAIHGGEKNLNVQFKIWHKDKLALTAAIELLLLAATIFFFRKARAEGSESLGKDLRFKRNVFLGLNIALAIISAHMLLAPVTFTDADIISLVPSP